MDSKSLCDRLTKDIWWYLGVIVLLYVMYSLGKSHGSKKKGKKEKFEECSEDGDDYKCVDGQRVYETFEECEEDGSDFRCVDGQKVYEQFSECEEDGSDYKCVDGMKVYEDFEECEEDSEYECIDGERVLRK